MKDKISDREINLVKLETFEKMGIMPKTHFPKGMRKAVEDDKKRALAEASNPNKKSLREKIWRDIALGVIIAVISALIWYFMRKYLFH